VTAALRALAVLTDPAAVWPRIAKEPDDAASLLSTYVAPFALIPLFSSLIGACIIGVIMPSLGVVRASPLDGIFSAILGYVATFANVLIVGFVIDVLAPMFGGRRDFNGAVKLAVYSFTPVWLAGIFLLLPGLRFLLLTGFYGAYVLKKGLPLLMKSAEQKSLPYAAIVVVLACALMLLTISAQRALFGGPGGV
jgi:hypothetical protein